MVRTIHRTTENVQSGTDPQNIDLKEIFPYSSTTDGNDISGVARNCNQIHYTHEL